MRFIHQMRLWQRFAVLGILGALLVIPPLSFYAREANKALDAAVLEQRGIEPVEHLLRLLRLVQQHRGLSAGALSGNQTMQTQRAAKQTEVDESIAKAEAVLKRGSLPAEVLASWEKARKEWTEIANAVAAGRARPAESFTRQTMIVNELLKLTDSLVDYFGLSLDPEADTYHLINAALLQAPFVTEELGKARARGAALLTQKSASIEERFAVVALIERARAREQSMVTALTKALAANPHVKESLGALFVQQVELSRKAQEAAEQHVIRAEELTFSPTEYFATCTAAIDAYFKLGDAAVTVLSQTLDARIDHLAQEKHLLVGIAGVLALISAMTGYAIARSILRGLGGEPAYASEIVHKIARGDLTVEVRTASGDDSSLLATMKTMQQELQSTVRRITEASKTIASGSSEIAAGNADLSQRTEEQASSLEETASSMEELTSTVRQSADNARQANQLAAGASAIAVKGGEVVGQVVSTMSGISESSKKIADIIGVIDGIAFQTNILALNAAVEAARAGEQGRGFAVVASEVRTLAQRSAAAAKEIKQLITDSVSKVEGGTKLVNQAGKTMEEIVTAVKRVTDIMAEITAAAQEQSSGIEQVNQAVMQMDQVTQQNAALVEQAAAAADSMQQQAQGLTRTVSVFKVAHSVSTASETEPADSSLPDTLIAAPVERRGANRAKNVSRLRAKTKLVPEASKARTERNGTEDDWSEF